MINRYGRFKFLHAKRKKIMEIAAQYGAKNLRVFGSVARGEDNSKSDVDFLIDMERGRSYFDLVSLSDALEKILKCKIDLITSKGVSPYLKKRIFFEAKPL